MTYNRAQLALAAGVDPWAMAAQVGSGDPAQVDELAARFYRASGFTSEAVTAESSAKRYAASGYQTDCWPLSADPDGYRATMLHADHHQLPAIAKLLAAVGDDLASAQRATTAQLTALESELNGIELARTTFVNQVGHRLPRDEEQGIEAGYLGQAAALVRVRARTVESLVDAYESTVARATATLTGLGYVTGAGLDLGTPPPVPARTTPPDTVALWWSGLTPRERNHLLTTGYRALGQLSGLPTAVLDTSNRRRLEDYLAKLERQLPTLLTAAGVFAALPVYARIRRCQQIEAALIDGTGPPRYLLGFDPEAPQGSTGVQLALGNPDVARDTTLFVPGTTHSAGDLPVVADTAATISNAMGSSSKSVIVWLDGPEPAHIVPDAAADSYADNSGPRLARDLAGLHAAHVAATGAASHVTAIGHSYGSVILGRALTAGGHRYVNDAVLVGSPGVGVNHAKDLGMDPGHVWSGQAGDDPILIVKNRFTPHADGLNPEERAFGARHFDVTGSHGHSHNFAGRSLRNIAHIADGAYSSVHTTRAPDYRGPRELFTDGLDAAVLDPIHPSAFGKEGTDLLHTGQDVWDTSLDVNRIVIDEPVTKIIGWMS